MKKEELTLTEIDALLAEYSSQSKNIEDLKRRLALDVLDILKKTIKYCEYVDAVRWTQFTPYFNDGESCVFGVHEIHYKFSDKYRHLYNSDEYHDDMGFVPAWHLKKFLNNGADIVNNEEIEEVQRVCTEINGIYERLLNLEDQLQEEFGDHCMVVLSKNGIDIETIDHD